MNYTDKQIANWRRIRVSIDPYLTNLEKIDAKLEAEKLKYEEKVAKLLTEADDIRKTIEMYEYPVKTITGFTTQDIFVKEVVVNDKVTANGRTIKKAVYNLRYPDTVIPPVENMTNNPETNTEM